MDLKDLDGSLVDDNCLSPDDEDRFRVARDGDHLITPFQCDECHFLNIHRRLPTASVEDERLQVAIRRAILDSLWSTERSTVSANFYQMKKVAQHASAYGVLDEFLPPRGPFPIEDTWGMSTATLFLARSTDSGRNAKFLQFDSVRKVRSTISNFYHTCPEGTGSVFMSTDGTSPRVSNSVTNSLWFKKFSLGCHRRMGDVWKPNRALTQPILAACFRILEDEWKTPKLTLERKRKISLTACLLISGYFGSLRGEEINRIHLGLIRRDWEEAVVYAGAPHVPLCLLGQFKRQVGEKTFLQPLCTITEDGFQIGSWFQRALVTLNRLNVTKGLLFSNGKGGRASIAEMDVLLYSVLERVQLKFPSILPDSVIIEDEFSVYRSLRRGSNTEARNVQIPRDIIDASMRWRAAMRNKGLTSSMPLAERYTCTIARANVPALIRYSSLLPMNR